MKAYPARVNALSCLALLVVLCGCVDASAATFLSAHANPSNVAAGQRVSYAVTVSNSAASSQNVKLTATVPANTTVAASELSLGAYCDDAGFTTCTAGQTLSFGFAVAAGASVTVVYPALVSTTAPPANGTLLNSDVWVDDGSAGSEYQVSVAAVASGTALSGPHLTVSALPAQVRAGGTVSNAKAGTSGREQSSEATPAAGRLPAAATERSDAQGAPRAAATVAAQAVRGILALDRAMTAIDPRTPYLNEGWLDFLAERLRTESDLAPRAVIETNVNQIGLARPSELTDVLVRSAHSALKYPIRYIILVGGLADSTESDAQSLELKVQQIIARDRQVIAQAHARGMKVLAATITAFEGTTYPNHTALDEAKRIAVNEWIRSGREYDVVIDFDLATSDPKHASRLLPAYDSGDHLHLNQTGLKALADAVDLSDFDE